MEQSSLRASRAVRTMAVGPRLPCNARANALAVGPVDPVSDSPPVTARSPPRLLLTSPVEHILRTAINDPLTDSPDCAMPRNGARTEAARSPGPSRTPAAR